jgi:hypothetical protein
MMKKILFLSLLLIFASKALLSQNYYRFELDSTSYNRLNNATVVDSFLADELQDIQIDLGFNFNYYGQSFSKIISYDAFFYFNPASYEVLMPFYTYYQKKKVASFSGLRFRTDQTPNGKIFKAEIANVDVLGVPPLNDTDSISFQMWLYENGTIEVHFGPSVVSAGANGFLPVCFFNNFDESKNVTIYEDPNNPSVGFDLPDSLTPIVGGLPKEGMVYRIIPSSINSVNNNLLQSQVKMYPNPSSGVVYIDSKINLEEVKVFTITGKEVLISLNTNKIDISELPPGMYFVELITPQGEKVLKKVQKQ